MATGFQIKNFSQLTASMVNWFSSVQTVITDFNVGSVARTLLEAVASELAEVYYRIYTGILAAQENAIYDSFDFPRLPAANAVGLVLWELSVLPIADTLIPLGAQAAVTATNVTAEIDFSTIASATIPVKTTLASTINSSVTAVPLTTAAHVEAGDFMRSGSEDMAVVSVTGNVATVTRGARSTTAASHTGGTDIGVIAKSVTMVSDQAGAAGNVGAGTVTKINTSVTGVYAVTNLAAFSGGFDEETDDARKKRFADYVSGLARGTKGAIEFGAQTATVTVAGVPVRCAKAKAYDVDDTEASLSAGTVDLYVSDSAGSMSSDLHDAVAAAVEAYRPAGVLVTVLAPTLVSVNVTAVLTVNPGFDKTAVIAQVQQTLTDYLASLNMGDDVFKSILIQRVIDSNSAAIANVAMSAPSGDTTIAFDHLARPGTLAITAA